MPYQTFGACAYGHRYGTYAKRGRMMTTCVADIRGGDLHNTSALPRESRCVFTGDTRLISIPCMYRQQFSVLREKYLGAYIPFFRRQIPTNTSCYAVGHTIQNFPADMPILSTYFCIPLGALAELWSYGHEVFISAIGSKCSPTKIVRRHTIGDR